MTSLKEPIPGDSTALSRTMDTINIAIIGANGVGKSAFMQRALKLSQPPSQQGFVVFNWTEADGTQHTVQMFEVDLEVFDLEMNEPIRWPRQANGQMAPRVDGTMVLYDVMNKESIKLLPQTLCESLCPCFAASRALLCILMCARSLPLRLQLYHNPRCDKMRHT